MSEFYSEDPKELLVQPEDVHFKDFLFGEFLDKVAITAPEVAKNKTKLAISAQNLLAEYQPDVSFYAVEDNAIGLLLAASLHAEAESDAQKSTIRTYRDELLSANFAATLFGRYSATRPLEDVKKASTLEKQARHDLYMKYANPELANQLSQWYENCQELSDHRAALNAQGTVTPFDFLVLTIGSDQHTKYLGNVIDPVHRAHIATYIEDMNVRSERFMVEDGYDAKDQLPYGMTVNLLGKMVVCIADPIARSIVNPEAVGFTKDLAARSEILSLIQHEAVHAQGNVELVDNNQVEESSYLGLLLEEYRAEVLSGKAGEEWYPDIYSVVAIVQDTLNVDIEHIIRSLPFGGGYDKTALYSHLINKLGLVNTAKLTGLLPENYATYQSPKSGREIYDLLGNCQMQDELIGGMSDDDIEAYLLRHTYSTEKDRKVVRQYLTTTRDRARYDVSNSV